MKSLFLIIGMIFITISINFSSSVYAFNDNSLFACVQNFFERYNYQLENMSEFERTNFTNDDYSNPDFLRVVYTETCMIGYEHSGTYSHLLSESEIQEYAKVAVSKIIGGSLSLLFNPE